MSAVNGWLRTGYHWYPEQHAYGNIFVNQQLSWEANYQFNLVFLEYFLNDFLFYI